MQHIKNSEAFFCAKHPKHPSLNQNPQVRRHAAPYIKWATRPSPPVSFWSSISSWSPKFLLQSSTKKPLKNHWKKQPNHFLSKMQPNHEKNKWTYLSQGFVAILLYTSFLLHEPKHQPRWLVSLQGLASLLNKAHFQPDLPSNGFNQNSAYFLLKTIVNPRVSKWDDRDFGQAQLPPHHHEVVRLICFVTSGLPIHTSLQEVHCICECQHLTDHKFSKRTTTNYRSFSDKHTHTLVEKQARKHTGK